MRQQLRKEFLSGREHFVVVKIVFDKIDSGHLLQWVFRKEYIVLVLDVGNYIFGKNNNN